MIIVFFAMVVEVKKKCCSPAEKSVIIKIKKIFSNVFTIYILFEIKYKK